MDTIFDLPAHPLLVHIPVMAIPLAAIGALLVALRPGWRRAYGPIVVALAGLGALGAVLTASSGESLQEAKRITDLGDHGELGETARNVALVFFVIVTALVVLDRWRNHERLRRVPAWAPVALAVLTVLSAAGAVLTVVAAGHSGAERVWENEQDADG